MKKSIIYESTPGGIKKKSDYTLVSFKDRNRLAVVKDSEGNIEEYGLSPNFSGWKLIIEGKDYEFLHSLSKEYAKEMVGNSRKKIGEINFYVVTLKHDKGKIRIQTSGDSEETAIKKVLDFENAPKSAVIKVEKVIPKKSTKKNKGISKSKRGIGKLSNSDELINKIIERGIITEKELNLLKNRKNRGEQMNDDLFYDEEISITKDQSTKGLKWLKNLWKSPTGKVRSSNPFGAREEEILSDFKDMYFSGFQDVGSFNHKFYVPIYTVCGAGMCFDYVTSSKGIDIIG